MVRQSLSIAVLTVSDTRQQADDRSGDVLVERLEGAGHKLAARALIRDEQADIERQFLSWAQDPDISVILCTGGTGITGRDVTPEALEAVATKMIPGFGELFRMISYKLIGTSTVQSRACAAVCGETLIFALPGSPSACRDGWDHILKDQLNIDHKPCNFAELLPRLGHRDG